MPDWIAVVILGIIEGITEFLPVSSTGHLLIAEHWNWIGERTEFFNVVIQGGAVLAVMAVFTARLKELVFNFSNPKNRDYVLKLAAAFVLTAVGGLALKKAGFTLPKDPAPIAIATLVGGVLFILVEFAIKGRKGADEISWGIALMIGVAQLIAVVFPGSSRSGTTILLALIFGASRPAAVEFSFLLGIPTLLAATAKETHEAIKGGAPHESWSLTALGVVVSAVTAFLSVRWLIGYVRTRTFTPFGWYRIAAGALILWVLR
jgi:undecaprenyl-diphosphatase